MTLLAEYSVTARRDRSIIKIHDVDAYLGDQAAQSAAAVQVVAGDGHHLYVVPWDPCHLNGEPA
ncbi:hypothetical protein ACFY6U_28970 [Streptomyces sp. NPDC013157]|uniref:hypothetical protein n=1 Tax=Streptomyces sp. NPDC013157 TaxID=3364861 RepID=UPI00369EB6F8